MLPFFKTKTKTRNEKDYIFPCIVLPFADCPGGLPAGTAERTREGEA